MPIYEFKCLNCQELFELLVMQNDEVLELRCPKCKSEDLDRVLSSTNYSMNAGAAGSQVSSQTRSCATGSCTTYDIPGPAR